MRALGKRTAFMMQIVKKRFEKLRPKLKKTASFLFNWHFMLCFGLGWMITNGWSYLCFAFGTIWHIDWLRRVATAYLALLWLPFTPEKIITAAIAILLLKAIFPNDTRTLAVLHELRLKAHKAFQEYRERRRAKKRGARMDQAAGDAPSPGQEPPLPRADGTPKSPDPNGQP